TQLCWSSGDRQKLMFVSVKQRYVPFELRLELRIEIIFRSPIAAEENLEINGSEPCNFTMAGSEMLDWMTHHDCETKTHSKCKRTYNLSERVIKMRLIGQSDSPSQTLHSVVRSTCRCSR